MIGILSAIEELAGKTDRIIVIGGWASGEAFRDVKRSVFDPFDHPDVLEDGAP